MKHIPTVLGALLGFIFVASGVVVLFKLTPMPPPPEGTPAGHFMMALAPTGYLTFIKVLEVLGGGLVAVPKTRNIGLLVLGPIVVNILAFHVFITGGQGLFAPPVLLVVVPSALLLWFERAAFCNLVTRAASRPAA
jgi:hypothetical protein